MTRAVLPRALNAARDMPLESLKASRLRLSTHFKTPVSLSLDHRRHISAYGYTQAKALVYSQYGEPKDVLSLHTHSISPPASTSITLRMLTAPINPADINQVQGVYPSKPPMNTSLGTNVPSAVAGNEGAAEVVGLGGSVKSVAKGDWVIMKSSAMGTWRTHMQADENEVLKIDDKTGLTPLQVATVSVNPCTAYRMLKDFTSWDWGAGEWFIQNGANSGVGRAAIQLGKEWGLKSINVIRERPGWEELKKELEGLGATKVVTEEQLMSKGFKDMIKEWTNGGREPIKLGLNCVGGKNATAIAKVLGQGAHMITYGAMSKKPTELPTALLIFKEIVFEGFWVSKWGDRNPVEKKQTVDDVLRMTREGRFKDIPVEEVKWDWETKIEPLKEAVQGTLEGFRKGKSVFVFGKT
jgi:mitochondrial enoyl-[acyl-carrier protein] reductase / trans-2-enoyl-CoA reductase